VNRRPLLLAVYACAALLALWLWWRDGHPVPLVDAPAGKLDCVSYTPPHDQPLGLSGTIAHAQIEQDLRVLAQRFRCIRIYAVSNGLDQIPAVAREVGLRVLLGLWIGRDPVLNDKEIQLGLAVAKRDHDVIDAVIVGNEVLLRREQTPDRLAALIRQVRAGTDLPVTYADVWDFWKVNPTLAADVDFVTIHLLPYWDDRPTGIDAALAHTASVYGEARTTFPDKRVFIGESGWPSQGRQRADAAPGRVAQARFVREFTHWAGGEGIAYNLIEAFDQPWKRAQEGTVGGYWGLYDAQGTPKFPLQGPLAEDADWTQGLWGAATGALLLSALGLAFSRRIGRPDLPLLVLAGAASGAVAVMQWRYLATTSRNLTEWIAGGAIALIGWLFCVWILLAFAGATSRQRLPAPESIHEALSRLDRRELRPRPTADGRSALLGLLRFALLLGLAYVCLGLAVDPRYRGFPTCLYAMPVLALLLLGLLDREARRLRFAQMPEETMLAALSGLCAIVIVLREGLYNPSALGLAGLALVFAGGLLLPAGHFAREHEQPQHHADRG
jgi:exo-beta-1,3-glucanase (GH17 family)